MRKPGYLVVVTLFFSLMADVSKAQLRNSKTTTLQSQWYAGYFNQSYFQSDFLPTKVMYATVGSSFITDDVRNRVIDKAKTQNRLAFELDHAIEAGYKLNDHQYLNLNIADRMMVFGNFAPGLVRLVAGGNKQFEGDTVQFGNSMFRYLRYQEFGLRYRHHFKNDQWFAATVNYVNGEGLFEVQTGPSYLGTTAQGQELYLELDGQLNRSDTTNKRFMGNNGNGISASFSFRAPLQLTEPFNDERGYIEFFADDIGWIGWNDRALEYDINQGYPYKGVYVENLATYNQAVFDQQSPDTVLTNIQRKGKFKTYDTYLPMKFGFEVGQAFYKKSMTRIGFQYRIVEQYIPMVWAAHEVKLNKLFEVSSSLQFGGMGIWGFGIGGGYTHPQFEVSLGTYNLDGLILAKSRRGASVFVDLVWKMDQGGEY